MGLDGVSRRRSAGGAGSGGRRQVTKERHDLPNLVFGQIPGRHRRVADAVIDVGEDLAICERRKRLAQGRRARIDMLANGCAAGAVEPVTDRALLLKSGRAGSDIGFIRLQRIRARGSFWRYAVQQQPSGNFGFNDGRRWTGAGKSGESETIQGGATGGQNQQDQSRDDSFPRHHLALVEPGWAAPVRRRSATFFGGFAGQSCVSSLASRAHR